MSESVKLSADVDGKLVEESIAVNIPKTWDFTNAEKTEKISFMKSLKAADIEIGGRVTTMRPWTVQHQGCGEKGVTVRISEEFFYNNNDNFDSKLKGKMLSLEWLRYKYGVFSEHGYSDDPLYPLTSTTSPTVVMSNLSTTAQFRRLGRQKLWSSYKTGFQIL